MSIGKALAIALLLAIVLYAILPILVAQPGVRTIPEEGPPPGKGMSYFRSYEELVGYLEEAAAQGGGFYGVGMPRPPPPTTTLATAAAAEEGYAGPRYSGTNVQVSGIDESDLVKTDGKYLYVIVWSQLAIVKAYPPEESEVVARLQFGGVIPGIYVDGDLLVVFEQGGPGLGMGSVIVHIFNLKDRGSPVEVKKIVVGGVYMDSRLHNHVLYVLAVDTPYKANITLPWIMVDTSLRRIPPSKIGYSGSLEPNPSYTIILPIDLKDLSKEPEPQVYLIGAGGTVYMSHHNLYIASAIPTRPPSPVLEGPAQTPGGTDLYITRIYRFSIDGTSFKYEGMGTVPGRPLNQFALDERDGYLRIATTRVVMEAGGPGTHPEVKSVNSLYILSLEDMKVVGGVEGIAPGEQIYAVRFLGEWCYLVTFRRIDPFFVIDVSKPESPRVLGWLKIPGYSSYLHPYGEKMIIGVGMEVKDNRPAGVKVSLFDVSDVENPVELDKLVLGGEYAQTPILYTHKAFLFDEQNSLVIIPVVEYRHVATGTYPAKPQAYIAYTFYVIEVSESGLRLKGNVTHVFKASYAGYWVMAPFRSPELAVRSLYIGDYLYTIAITQIKIARIDDLSPVKGIDLLSY